MQRYRFVKQERLKRKKWIALLFEKGYSLHLPPVRVYHVACQADALPCHQVLFTVPKRHVKKAVARHHLVRKLREAYRLSKAELPSPKQTGVGFLLAYV